MSLLPSQRQVVFRGDRLPFHCTAALVDKITTLHWRHNGHVVTSDPEMGVQLEESVVHDCTFITRCSNWSFVDPLMKIFGSDDTIFHVIQIICIDSQTIERKETPYISLVFDDNVL